MRAFCRCTRRRFERTHGGLLLPLSFALSSLSLSLFFSSFLLSFFLFLLFLLLLFLKVHEAPTIFTLLKINTQGNKSGCGHFLQIGEKASREKNPAGNHFGWHCTFAPLEAISYDILLHIVLIKDNFSSISFISSQSKDIADISMLGKNLFSFSTKLLEDI